ncbi:MAG: DUF63 family protein [Methanocorpusculum sp.]|nr:DUF63 family protein [Methanocorpusculum sp.]
MFDDIYQWIVGLEASTYTVVQTILYACLVLIGLFLLYKWLKKVNIPVDTTFILSSITYVVFGAILRAVEDTGMIPDPWWILFITPQVYILTAIYAAVMLFISYTLQKKKKVISYTTPYILGAVVPSILVFGMMCGFGVSQSNVDLVGGIIVLAIGAASAVLLWALLRYVFRWEYASRPLYVALIASHMLDASATSFAIAFRNYYEQHVLGGTLIELTGTPYIMFALKIAVLIPAVWILEQFKKDEKMDMLWHLVIVAMIVVGLGPGIRDMLRMIFCV